MTTENTGRTLSAMFDTRAEADRAAESLRNMGIADVVMHGEGDTGYTAERNAQYEERGFFDSLGDFFFPAEDRATYAEGLHRGAYLVTVNNVPENQVPRALEILEAEGAVDLDRRESEWRNTGWTAETVPGAASYAESQGQKIDVVEEELVVGKRDVDHGSVRARSYVREIPVSKDVELTQENVTIERRAVDREATGDAFKDQTIEARVSGEEAVVRKDARVVEEVELNKTANTRVETVEDTVRKTEVEIEDTTDRGL